MPAPEQYTYEIGRQPTTCQVHTTGTHVSLPAPEKNDFSPLATQKIILHMVPINSIELIRRKEKE